MLTSFMLPVRVSTVLATISVTWSPGDVSQAISSRHAATWLVEMRPSVMRSANVDAARSVIAWLMLSAERGSAEADSSRKAGGRKSAEFERWVNGRVEEVG